MFQTSTFLLLLFLISFSKQDVVDPIKACDRVGRYYNRGSSELVAKLLNKPWISDVGYIEGALIGSNNNYTGVVKGEIVGYPGHVAVYVGNHGCSCVFVDVPESETTARCVRFGYGSKKVYKMYY